ncbi:hypothetical protein DFJ63DRAFT_338829 [Scheffersomyces coipomensis]|uniref:uncharacterized protein n=1 Tax=Scheffersomyces coipomensis TaxID=1788519 RepID=UPI00315D4DAC
MYTSLRVSVVNGNYNTKPVITILKFKRGRATYVLTFDLSQSKTLTVQVFKQKLAQIIKSSGGLAIEDADPISADLDGDQDIDEESIPVPKPEFMEDIEIEDDPNIIKEVNAAELRIAVPKDKASPYDNEWIEISDDSTLASLIFNDYDIIAFAYGEEDTFDVIEAAFEE